jgi:hypothetical protein
VRDLILLEVRLQSRDGTPVVLLAEAATGRVLPIWMSAAGAAAIVSAPDAEDPDRPGIHDLAVLLLGEARAVISEARIVGYSDGQFYAAVMVGGELVAASLGRHRTRVAGRLPDPRHGRGAGGGVGRRERNPCSGAGGVQGLPRPGVPGRLLPTLR